MTTLTYGGTTVDLPDDLAWSDEYGWQAVAQSLRHSITGAVLREATVKASGRPVTLQGAADAAWITRASLDTLRAWADIPGAVMRLTLRGVVRAVVFDHEAGPIDAEPIVFYSDPAADDPYVVTLRFRTVPT